MANPTATITGTEDLQALILRVRDLPEFVNQCAPDAARQVQEKLDLTINAGADPWGSAWAPKKQGHGKPLAHAAGAVFVGAIGTKIMIRLTGIESRHHRGWAKGGTKRVVIPTPDRDLPVPVTDAIFKVITDSFTAYMTKP
jgi:hypothetical protein